MNKFSKSILASVLIVGSVFGQQVNMVTGPKLKGVRVIEDAKLSDNELMVVSSNGSAINTWQLSPVTLVPKGESTPIAAGGSAAKNNKKVVNASEMKMLSLLSLDKKDVIFYSKYQKQDKTTQLFYENIDNSGKVMDMPKKLASNNNKASSGLGALFGLGASGPINSGYNIRTNNKKDLILITNQGADIKKNKSYVPAPANITLFDSDMNEKGSTTLDLEISNFGSSALLSNNGFVYNLVKVTLDRKSAKESRRNGEASWYYKLVGVNLMQQDAKPFEYDLIFKNRGILTASIDITASGELICAGTYSELTSRGNIDDFDGIFYCKLDPNTGQVVSDNIKKLDRNIVEALTSKKNAKKNEGVSTEFKIRGLVALDNGTSDLLLEEDYLIIVTTYNGKTTTTTYHYYSKSIMVANIAANGEINWVKRIPKFQHTTNDGGAFNSFTHVKDKDGLRIIFTDNKQNYDPKTGMLNQQKVKNLTSSKEGKSVILVTINGNGDIVQKKVAETQKNLLYTRNAIWNKSGNEVYFQSTPRTSFGQCLLGILCPPYGCYLYFKKLSPDMNLSRLEIE